MSNPSEAVSDAAQTHIGGFHPASRSDLHGFFEGLPDMIRTIGDSFARAADNMADEPVHPAVTEALRELGQIQSGIADHADEVWSQHLKQHELWLND